MSYIEFLNSINNTNKNELMFKYFNQFVTVYSMINLYDELDISIYSFNTNNICFSINSNKNNKIIEYIKNFSVIYTYRTPYMINSYMSDNIIYIAISNK